eukprot:1145512-Amphidinium_carterae.1
MKVGPPGDDRLHYLAMTGCDHKVICIFPADFTSGGAEASGRRPPPEAVAEGSEMPDRSSPATTFGGISPLLLRGRPALPG